MYWLLFVSLLGSCHKEADAPPTPTSEEQLKARVWVFDEIIGYEDGYPPEIIYKRAYNYNQLDLSLVESKFLDNGVWNYIDPLGRPSTGSWKLSDNNTKIEFRGPATSSPEIGQEVRITANSFTYKLVESNGYSIHKMIPKP